MNLRSDVFPAGNNQYQPQFYLTLKETSETRANGKTRRILVPGWRIQSNWEPCHGEVLGVMMTRNWLGLPVPDPFKKESICTQFPDGKMIIWCKIYWLAESKQKHFKQGMPMICAPEPSNLDMDLANLFESGNFSDVKVNCSGTVFQCHKNILAARSPVFAAMFQHDMKESSENEVEIDGIEPEVLKEMLTFIYSGRCDMQKMTSDLLVAADRYDLKNLKKNCEIELAKSLSLKNALQILSLTEKISAPYLEEKTNEFCMCIKSELIKDMDAKSTFSFAMHSKPNELKEDSGQKVKSTRSFFNFWK